MSEQPDSIVVFRRHLISEKYREFLHDMFSIPIYDFRAEQLTSWSEVTHFSRYQVVFAYQPKDRELNLARKVFSGYEPIIIPEVPR